MKKKYICLLFLLIILIPAKVMCVSGDTEHDTDLKDIFWGKNSAHDDTEELIVLQWAAYFAVDCIASSKSSTSDEYGLALLKNYGVKDVPKHVSAFHYKDNKFENQHHERYTHLGWNFDYANNRKEDLSNWATVRKPLFSVGKKGLVGHFGFYRMVSSSQNQHE